MKIKVRFLVDYLIKKQAPQFIIITAKLFKFKTLVFTPLVIYFPTFIYIFITILLKYNKN